MEGDEDHLYSSPRSLFQLERGVSYAQCTAGHDE